MNQLALFSADVTDVTVPARSPDELLASGLSVIDQAFEAGATMMFPLYSGGYDSICACYVASKHERFTQDVHHINTGIGSKITHQFVEESCEELGWNLRVYKSQATYQQFVAVFGFPGPGSHQWVYARLKERCVRMMTKGRGRVALITGCREQESTRRMGHVEPIKVGEISKKTGKVSNKNRVWCAPCHDWSKEEQLIFMEEFDLPKNPLKATPLGMSGECFCGAFAKPAEMAMLRVYVPDVAEEIDRLTVIAKLCGTPCEWGTRPDKAKGIVVSETGMMCSGCDARARTAGLLFDNR